MSGSGRFRGLIVFLLLLFCSVFFFQIYPHFISTNEHSRLLLTSAIVDDHTIQIDKAIQRFGDTQDKSFFDGHYYSEKAAGISILGVPVYFVLRIFKIQADPSLYLFWLKLFCVTIPSICFVVFLSRFWTRMFNGRWNTMLAFVYMFGTVAFTYSLQFISHHLTGIALFLSFYFGWAASYDAKSEYRLPFLSSLFAGAALIMEYPAIVQVGILSLYVCFRLHSVRKVIVFATGLLPFVIFILSYNYAIFGTPFDVTYHHSLVLNVNWDLPTPKALNGLLFSPSRGLFFYSPVLLLSIPGLYQLIKNKKFRFEGIFVAAIVLSTVLVHAGMSNWDAGWSLGPRYLTPVIPFLMTATTFYLSNETSFKTTKMFFCVAGSIISIFMITVGTMTFPFPAQEISNPVFSLFVPMMVNGAYSFNIPEQFGLRGFAVALLFYTTLIITCLVMCTRAGEMRFPTLKEARVPLMAMLCALGMIVVGLVFNPAPNSFLLYARASMYFFVGNCNDSYHDLGKALQLNPDEHLKQLIFQRLWLIKQTCRSSRGNSASGWRDKLI